MKADTLRRVVRLAWLTVQAWIGLVAFDLARVRPSFARLCAGSASAIPRSDVTHSAQQRIVWSVDEACLPVKRAPVFSVRSGEPVLRVTGSRRRWSWLPPAALRISRVGARSTAVSSTICRSTSARSPFSIDCDSSNVHAIWNLHVR